MLASDTMPDPAPKARLAIRRLPARRAGDWLAAGWADFRRTPAPLAVASIALLIAAVLAARAAAWLPVLLSPLYLGTVAAYARMADQGQVFLAGSGAWRRASLWGLGLVLALLLALLDSLLAAGGAGALDVLVSAPTEGFLAVVALLYLARLLAILALAACWLAPALIVNHDAGMLQALRLSLVGSLRNAGAFLVMVLIANVLLVLAALPLGLGLVVVMPVLACAAARAADEIVAHALRLGPGGIQLLP